MMLCVFGKRKRGLCSLSLCGRAVEASGCAQEEHICSCSLTLLQVAQLPEKDELSWSKMQLTARMDVAMGGRVAEEIVFGPDNITSGKEEIVWGRREGEVRRGGIGEGEGWREE